MRLIDYYHNKYHHCHHQRTAQPFKVAIFQCDIICASERNENRIKVVKWAVSQIRIARACRALVIGEKWSPSKRIVIMLTLEWACMWLWSQWCYGTYIQVQTFIQWKRNEHKHHIQRPLRKQPRIARTFTGLLALSR